MTARLIIAPEVEQDLAEAYAWYEGRQRSGMGGCPRLALGGLERGFHQRHPVGTVARCRIGYRDPHELTNMPRGTGRLATEKIMNREDAKSAKTTCPLFASWRFPLPAIVDEQGKRYRETLNGKPVEPRRHEEREDVVPHLRVLAVSSF